MEITADLIKALEDGYRRYSSDERNPEPWGEIGEKYRDALHAVLSAVKRTAERESASVSQAPPTL